MIGFYSGGGKNRKIMGKQRIFRRTGFLEKHTNSELFTIGNQNTFKN